MTSHVFRAADMALIQLYFARDISRSAINTLGELQCVHFCDLNFGVNTFQRQFVTEIRKLNEVLNAINQLEQFVGLPDIVNQEYLKSDLISFNDVQQLGNELISDHLKLKQINDSFKKLKLKRNQLIEEREVLEFSHQFFGNNENNVDLELMSVLAGTCPSSKVNALERLCWRSTRGNLYFAKGASQNDEKHVFLVYTHGLETTKRVQRLAESLECETYKLHFNGRNERIEEINLLLDDLFAVLDQTSQNLEVEKDLVYKRLPALKAVFVKELKIFNTLNLCSVDNSRQGLLAEGWVPQDQLSEVKMKMDILSGETSQLAVVNRISTSKTPPTYHTTNKVTSAFQAMVDVYGIARYGEVNPGLPTVVTFPFMFAVMFGDVGHGFILMLGALVLVLRERKISMQTQRDELFDMAFNGRYVLLLMGLFSMYTGFLYNDIFSRSMTLFSSAFEFPEHSDGEQVSATRVGNSVYPFGLDWAWHGADNNLRFTNSYKMKLSVLLGFVHMTYSLCFQLVNARHENSFVDVWGNFVPSMLFMQSIFGYLSLTIVYKWSVNWLEIQKQPPGLLDMLIKMFLSPGTVDTPLYKGQAFVQVLLLVLALVCVPWLLLFKPLYIRRQQKSGKAGFAPLRLDEHTFAIDEDEGNALEFEIYDENDEESLLGDVNAHNQFETGDDLNDHANESFGDIMIHQVIHTIEFCLNCISHTASYLRLWALSLAHNQLSQVLWNMTLANAFGPGGKMGVVMVVVLFGMWFTITVLVLVCMEGTSAMLHALRLHWVEAMSKHFIGEGYAFVPLDLYAV